MRFYVFWVGMALLAASGAQAQERTAGQSFDAQVNWSALSSKIDLISTQNKALAATLDKVMACNAQKKIYAPGQSGADGNGCVAVGSTFHFGGMFSLTSARLCRKPNPVTGACSCPAGYTQTLLADAISGAEQYLYYCFD